jgi:hypothetical protein
MFDDLSIELHKTAVEKGFWPEDVDDIFVTKQLMMIVSEAVEVWRQFVKTRERQRLLMKWQTFLSALSISTLV